MSAENKKSKIISFQLQSNTDRERERGKVCGCLLPGNIIKRAFNLIEFNPGGSSVPIVYNRTSICLMCHDIMAKVTRYFIASSSSSAVTKRAVNCRF